MRDTTIACGNDRQLADALRDVLCATRPSPWRWSDAAATAALPDLRERYFVLAVSETARDFAVAAFYIGSLSSRYSECLMARQFPALPINSMRNGELEVKLDYMKLAISPMLLKEAGVTRSDWLLRFRLKALAVRLGYQITSEAAANKVIAGSLPVSPAQLEELADWLMLTARFGSSENAAYLLSTVCSFEEFTQELLGAGWADPLAAAQGLRTSLTLLLKEFQPFNLSQHGLWLGDPVLFAPRPLGLTRGSRPRRDDREKLQDVAIGQDYDFSVGDVPETRGLILLEISPAIAPGAPHPVVCLAPSSTVPGIDVGNAAPREDLGRFEGAGPVGRYDWLAVLTLNPLPLPWSSIEDTHVLSKGELDWLVQRLAKQLAKPETAAALEVRHKPFTIGMGD